MQYLIEFCSRLEAASEVISNNCTKPIISNECVKFIDSRLNRSPEIPPNAIRGGIFDCFFRINFRPEVVSGVISGVAVEYVGVDVNVKCAILLKNTWGNLMQEASVQNSRNC